MNRAPTLVVVALLAIVAAPLVTAAPAAATTVPAFTTEQLTQRADVVARVRITSSHVERVGRAGRLATFYEAVVVDAWKSPGDAPPATVLIALPGGVQDGIGQLVPGTPVLRVGDDLVVFLGEPVGPRGARATIGLWLGVLHIGAAGPDRGPSAPVFPSTHDGKAATPAFELDQLRARVVGAPR